MRSVWRRLYRGLFTALALLGTLFVVVTVTPIVPWWARTLAGRWSEPPGDVLIVLAAAETADFDGIIADNTYFRTIYAVHAYRRSPFATVVLSGGSASGRTPTSLAMRDFMEAEGVPPDVIVVETKSVSTRTNALETAQLIKNIPGTKVLITSDYHMYRAVRTFRKVGIDVVPHPVPDVLKRAGKWEWRWSAFLELCIESVKISYYYRRGWM